MSGEAHEAAVTNCQKAPANAPTRQPSAAQSALFLRDALSISRKDRVVTRAVPPFRVAQSLPGFGANASKTCFDDCYLGRDGTWLRVVSGERADEWLIDCSHGFPGDAVSG